MLVESLCILAIRYNSDNIHRQSKEIAVVAGLVLRVHFVLAVVPSFVCGDGVV